MKRTVILLPFFFLTCVSMQHQETAPIEASSFYVTIANKTGFDISILTEDRLIPSGTNRDIQLPIQRNQLSEGYQLTCYVTIADDVIKVIPLEKKIIKKEEENVIIDNIHFISNESFLVITNETKSTVKVRRTNSETYRSGLGPGTNREGGRIELLPGKTHVYPLEVFPCSIQNERDVLFAIPPNTGGEGFVNYFVFNGSAVTLTDARPLHRIGETAWAKTINNATGPMPLAAADGEIHLFASTDKGLIRNVYNSTGIIKGPVRNGDGFFITYASKTENGFFVAGYEKLKNGDFQPVARMHNMDGSTRYALEHSTEYTSARFFTAAQKDNAAWLLAGEGVQKGARNNTAYARMVQVKNNKLMAVWELSPDKCGDIQAAAYDTTRDCWLVTGENLDGGSYIAQIDSNGKIIKPNYSFKDMSFYKILIDTNGVCYLAGEEQQGNETYAVLGKYNVNDSRFQRMSAQAASHSYYNDALLDTANNRIILGGVMKAADETGRDGVPFIEAIDIQTGTRLCEELSHPDIKETGAALVTAIAPAPDYGYALTLSGIGSTTGFYEEPYMMVRVNSQGKYLKEVRP